MHVICVAGFRSDDSAGVSTAASPGLDCKQCQEKFSCFEKFCDHLMHHSRRFACTVSIIPVFSNSVAFISLSNIYR